MALQFDRVEYEERLAAARAALRARGLSALLAFAQESNYYLTGFDTTGYVFFQCVVLTADQRPPVLLTRRPDLEGARRTSIIEDIRIWYDAPGANPAEDLRGILAEQGLAGERIGIELNTYGLTPANYAAIQSALGDWCRLEDASDLVRALRVVKSPAELAYVRRAAALGDDALTAMVETAGPRVFEGEVLAAGQSAMLRGGGDVAASGPVLGSGDRALLVRSSTGFSTLGERDQLTIEFGASFRRYHACLMRTLVIGPASAQQRRMFDATRDAMEAMIAAVRPGQPIGAIDDAHRGVYDAAGFGHARLAACGYSLGATYRPSWMDVPPMIFSGNATPQEAGMVLFLHAILLDARTNLAMSLGYTVIVTPEGAEVLSRHAPALVECR